MFGVGRMSSKRPGVKKAGESERQKGKEGEEGERREVRWVWRMPLPPTAVEPMFCPLNTASLRQLSSGTWTAGKNVNSRESSGRSLHRQEWAKVKNACHPTGPSRGWHRLHCCRNGSQKYPYPFPFYMFVFVSNDFYQSPFSDLTVSPHHSLLEETNSSTRTLWWKSRRLRNRRFRLSNLALGYLCPGPHQRRSPCPCADSQGQGVLRCCPPDLRHLPRWSSIQTLPESRVGRELQAAWQCHTHNHILTRRDKHEACARTHAHLHMNAHMCTHTRTQTNTWYARRERPARFFLAREDRREGEKGYWG